MKTLKTRIALAARRQIGRPARRSRRLDWGAVAAVKAAARAEGLTLPLEAWVPPEGGTSLLGLARAFMARYAQAYGPVEGLIDVGAHLGVPGAPVAVQT